ncbi:hypothetical protein [Paludibaculum fermentans]|uniref:Uncharacterized protein n=1 Tax=Paludibaculum fermentans TaxID=1473598 RepID=A0A7S7NT36_PALFE|nr:hypothetical protein [Paludibaculum fermentans]QOY89250.1 hypothetical protein IRI77_04650 [Paludibaculum fermentans]
MNKFLLIVVILAGFVILFGVGQAWKLKPETAENHMLHKGEVAVLTNTTGQAIWLAQSREDTRILQSAMGKQDRTALEKAEAEQTALPMTTGTQVRVKVDDGSRYQVEILDGPEAGRLGWVEFEYLRPIRPSETH